MVRPHLMPLVIAGPTASGKSSLALRLALKFKGEIICADSLQFYKDMSIGTAAPTIQDCAQVPHHGYQTLDPASFKGDAGFFVEFAKRTIKEVQNRGNRPILVGGTGLYLRSLRYGLADVPVSDKTLLAELEKRCDEKGLLALYEELLALDPKTAQALSKNDRYRIIRALEIYYVSCLKPSEMRKSFTNKEVKIKAHWLYKKPIKEQLFNTIAHRVRRMFDDGLIQEAVELRQKLKPDHWALSVMGYQEALQYVDKAISQEQAIERTIIRHRQYAKRQYTWFNKEDFYRFIIS